MRVNPGRKKGGRTLVGSQWKLLQGLCLKDRTGRDFSFGQGRWRSVFTCIIRLSDRETHCNEPKGTRNVLGYISLRGCRNKGRSGNFILIINHQCVSTVRHLGTEELQPLTFSVHLLQSPLSASLCCRLWSAHTVPALALYTFCS